MLGATVRRAVRRAGLTGVARRALLLVAGDERRVAVDGTEATFEQRDFGDYIELNQVEPESEVIADLRDAVEPDDVFLDVGSNLGGFAVFVGDRLAEGEVIAVEPVPETAAKAERNLERNGVPASVHRVAFSDGDGTATMSVPDAHGSAALSTDESGPTDGSGPTVERVVGDRYLTDRDLPSPTVAKVDVEGHEAAALRGLRETLSRPACRLVYCEVHGGTAAEREVRDLLGEFGFDVETAATLPGERRVLRAART